MLDEKFYYNINSKKCDNTYTTLLFIHQKIFGTVQENKILTQLESIFDHLISLFSVSVDSKNVFIFSLMMDLSGSVGC